ncbi:MAG: hypothetical protein LUH55_12975 [Bacteroides thetaiotaomicron]|nr:hypothetical protein [Bacteroides thetaiotaomicron]
MKLAYSDIKEFERIYSEGSTVAELNRTKCECGSYFEMDFAPVEVAIGKYNIRIPECPIMACKGCGRRHICPNIPQEIYTSYFEMENKRCSDCKLTMKADIHYEFAKDANFIYGSRDMSIPGLGIDLDPTHPDGYSCPVYFDRKVLSNFLTDNDYELDFFSESYGEIAKKGTDGWLYEWKIAFGINSNNRVIFFLGDLHQIESNDRAIYWLKSYNIPSDHIIVDTELYRGQIECQFSEPIIEQRIVSLRNAFFKHIQDEYGINLFHLENEVEAKGKELKKPVSFSRSEVKENIIILDGMLNEGIDCNALRSLCSQIVNQPPENLKSLKTRKLLQRIIASKSGDEEAEKIVAPLFYLNDLRVCFAHLIPQSEIDNYQGNIVRAFGLSDFTDYKKCMIYYWTNYIRYINILMSQIFS